MTMNSIGKIHTYPNNPRVWKAQIAAAYLGLDLELNTSIEMGKTNRTKEFLAEFPLGKYPALQTPEGPIFESDAIAYYVANYVKDSPLLGANSYEKALVQQWVSFATCEVLGHAGKWLYPILGYATYNKEVETKAKEDLKRALVALDAVLLKKTFLVGERVTLADISVACSLAWPYQHILDPSYRSAFPNVNRWYLTVMNQPNVKKVVGEVKMCDKAAVYDAKKFQQEKKPAAEKKPAEKPAPAAAADEDEGPKEEKKKNPLDLLPPSKFNLDAWKRFYSNNDTRPTAINFFWENYDPEGFSMWKVDYKYNDELGLIFQSSNLIGGFFQRLDRARKYAFGSMIVTGENNANQISGYFIFRGQDVPFEVTDAADYESYQFTKVDPQAVRETFNDYLAWDGNNFPGKFADGKIFK